MSVLQCHRKDCEHIMCETYLSEIGYICYSCQAEFSDYLTGLGLYSLPKREMFRMLQDFMQTPQGYYSEGGKEITVDDLFSAGRGEDHYD